jgi:hypothetical protein
MVRWLMNNNLERIWKETVLAYSRCYPDICQEGTHTSRIQMRNITAILTHSALLHLDQCVTFCAVYAYKEYVSRTLGRRTNRDLKYCSCRPQWPSARSKAWTVFARSNTGIVARIPLEAWMSVCVCVVLFVGRGLATCWSPVQGVYRMCIGPRNWKAAKTQQRVVEP